MSKFRASLSILLSISVLANAATAANAPSWWTDPATRVLEPGATARDYSPVTLGQLKYVATQAKTYLDLKLAVAGGAGPEVDAVCQFSLDGNYSPVNLGQLKYIAKPFYDRLASIGYDWDSGTYDIPNPLYPWTITKGAANEAPATLGQLKFVFAFELDVMFLSQDTDHDSLPDWHEKLVGTSITNSDSDGDGWSDSFEVRTGSSPILATSVPANSDDPDQDGLDNYWEKGLGLQPDRVDTDGDGISDGDEDADNDGVINRLDAHPMQQLIGWARVPECRYVVVPLENGFSPYASRKPKFWHLNDRGDVVGFADPANPDSSMPGYRVPILWTNGAWSTLGGSGFLEVANASRRNTSTTLPVRFYTLEGGTEAPIQIDNDRRIAAMAQLQEKVSAPHAPNWGSLRLASLVWQPAGGSVGATAVPIGRNPAWQNTSTQNYTTAFDKNGMLASIGSGGVVLVNSADPTGSDIASQRLNNPSPSVYQDLGNRGTPLFLDYATARGSSIDDFACGNFQKNGSGSPYGVWDQNSILREFPRFASAPGYMALPLAIQRLAKGPGSTAQENPLVVLDGNGRLAVSTNWLQPVVLGLTDSSGAPSEVLDLARTTINTRGEILWQWNTLLPAPTPPPRIWRNGRLRFVNDLLYSTSWTVAAVHHLNNNGVILATASTATSGAQPVLLVPVEVLQYPITANNGTGTATPTDASIRFCRWLEAYPGGVRDNQFVDKDRDRFQIRLPIVVPNLTKMKIKTTDLHGAVVNGAYENKTADGDYEVDLLHLNGKTVSEPILLVSDGDDDKTFNGKGTDDGMNDQTLLADFESKIVVVFPELADQTATFVAQAPVGEITIDLYYCADSPGAVPAQMQQLIDLQVFKMKEIYRQIGIRIITSQIGKITFPSTWLQANGSSDPARNLNSRETEELRILVQKTPLHLKTMRVGFVDAALTNAQGGGVSGLTTAVGSDPSLISLNASNRTLFNLLAHEAGHCSSLIDIFQINEPNLSHWLMREAAGQNWSDDSMAPKRFKTSENELIVNTSQYYVPLK